MYFYTLRTINIFYTISEKNQHGIDPQFLKKWKIDRRNGPKIGCQVGKLYF